MAITSWREVPWAMSFPDRPAFRRFVLLRRYTAPISWHKNKKWYAKARGMFWALAGHDAEICCCCGGRVRLVFHVPNHLWIKYSGLPRGQGILCVHCFDERFRAQSKDFLRWTCEDNDTMMRT